jgi:D-3-phosphoglycerate dehydrogenase
LGIVRFQFDGPPVSFNLIERLLAVSFRPIVSAQMICWGDNEKYGYEQQERPRAAFHGDRMARGERCGQAWAASGCLRFDSAQNGAYDALVFAMKVLISDPISPRGVEILRQNPQIFVIELDKPSEEQLEKIIADCDALIVRSQTKVTAKIIEAAKKLRVIGRAGVGVDNVDVDAATARGIIVMNTPAGNTISTAEHTFSLLMSVARNIPQAHASMKSAQWDRASFKGVELYNKTLGVIGMGRIGTEVARRAIAFGMRVIAYDPFLSSSRAKTMQVELVELDELYARADFITVHVPLTDETRGLIDKKAFAKMKNGVRIINCARGGVIVEADLADALKSGKVAGAALDVFEEEPPPKNFPLRDLPNVIMTPHLGAATTEAQESVGIEIAEAVRDALTGGIIRNAVNMPTLDAKSLEILRPYFVLGEKLGKLLAALSPKRVEKLTVEYRGKAAELNAEPITRSILKGFLENVAGADVNFVNAPVLAHQLGIRVEETRTLESLDYTELIAVRTVSEGKTASVGGTFYGTLNNPRVVRINEMPVEVVPSGVLFIMTNKDRPGIVGWIGTVMGEHNVNIASMSLGRDKIGGKALTVLNLDSMPSEEVLEKIRQAKDIFGVKVAQL